MVLGECTRMSLLDQERITGDLRWTQTELCASGASRGRRPRNYWTWPEVRDRDGFQVRVAAHGLGRVP